MLYFADAESFAALASNYLSEYAECAFRAHSVSSEEAVRLARLHGQAIELGDRPEVPDPVLAHVPIDRDARIREIRFRPGDVVLVPSADRCSYIAFGIDGV